MPTTDKNNVQPPAWLDAIRSATPDLPARLQLIASVLSRPRLEVVTALRILAKEHGFSRADVQKEYNALVRARKQKAETADQDKAAQSDARNASLNVSDATIASSLGEQLPPQSLRTPLSSSFSWPGGATETKSGMRPLLNTYNLRAMMAAYGIDAWWDTVRKRASWRLSGVAADMFNRDDKLNTIVRELAQLNGMKAGGEFDQFLTTTVMDTAKNEAREYFDGLTGRWDGKPRFGALLEALGNEQPITTVALRCMLIGACAAADEARIAMNNNHRGTRGERAHRVFEYLILFAGPQGMGKTKGIRDMLPSKLHHLFGEGVILDVHNKDDQIGALSWWICELGELDATFKRTEVVAMKAFLSKSNDRIRPPYGRSWIDFPRTTLFVGTVNSETPLMDRTGNRRYLPFAAPRFDHGWPEAEIEQLWAEAWHRYAVQGEQWWPTPEEQQISYVAQSQLVTESYLTEKLMRRFDWNAATDGKRHDRRMSLLEIAELLGEGEASFVGGKLGQAITHLWLQHGAVMQGPEITVTNYEGKVARARSTDGRNRGWIMPPLNKSEI